MARPGPGTTRAFARTSTRRTAGRAPAAFLALTATALGLLLGPGAGVAAGADQQALQNRIDSARAGISASRSREAALSQGIAQFSNLIGQLQTQIAGLQAVQARLEAQLQRSLAIAARLQAAKEREQARVRRLRRRLAYSKRVLARRLVAVYKSSPPDVVGVVLGAHDIADLVDRVEYMRRVNAQDKSIITLVRVTKQLAKAAADRLAALEARQRAVSDMIATRRNQVAAARNALASRQAAVAQARAERAAALQATRANRRNLQGSLGTLESKLAKLQQTVNGLGPAGGWSIPWGIVNCESGGRNTGPNWAGASGYYQIIPSTWQLFGGHGSAAHLAPKREQDRVASRIYNGGSGVGNWDCARF
jgi:peptidoglycan hydrolase CwlO-like protein